jgi:hypothetical protein
LNRGAVCFNMNLGNASLENFDADWGQRNPPHV